MCNNIVTSFQQLQKQGGLILSIIINPLHCCLQGCQGCVLGSPCQSTCASRDWVLSRSLGLHKILQALRVSFHTGCCPFCVSLPPPLQPKQSSKQSCQRGSSFLTTCVPCPLTLMLGFCSQPVYQEYEFLLQVLSKGQSWLSLPHCPIFCIVLNVMRHEIIPQPALQGRD